MAPVFFNTFVNVDKYLDYEQRDPVANNKAQEMSDWEKYAAEQYDMLIAEEEEQELVAFNLVFALLISELLCVLIYRQEYLLLLVVYNFSLDPMLILHQKIRRFYL